MAILGTDINKSPFEQLFYKSRGKDKKHRLFTVK